MNYRVRYTPQAEAKLLNWLPSWRTAGDVDGAVQRFAARRAAAAPSRTYLQVHAAGHCAIVVVDHAEQRVDVLAIVRVR
jgi:hypothetical protein